MSIDENPADLPPLGPMGKGGYSRRAAMYAHNRKVAARQHEIRRKVEEGALPVSAAADLPPPGPTGKGYKSQRAKMYAHNRKLAARRRKADQDKPQKS